MPPNQACGPNWTHVGMGGWSALPDFVHYSIKATLSLGTEAGMHENLIY